MDSVARTVAALGLAAAVACGGSSGPGGGGPTPPSPPPATISGTVVSNPGQRPVPNATIQAAGATLAVTSADGRFSFANTGPRAVSISAEGYLTRQTRIAGQRADVVIDLIALAPPFELDFYRQLARDGQDTGRLAALARWSVNPAVYFFTNRVSPLGEDTGEPVPQALVDLCRSVLPGIVSEVTAGRLGVARFESGTDASVIRSGRPGSIAITFRRRFRQASTEGPTDCVDGASVVSNDVATVNLCYSTEGGECTLISPGVIAHEVGHALGLHHACFPAGPVGAPYTMCRGSGSAAARRCQAGFDAKELFHSAILYSRPGGNVDPDQDPDGFAF